MIQTLFPFLPTQLNTIALIVAIVGALLGAGLWLIGSKYSRTLVTLITVSMGMLAGLQLPGWFAWKIEGWATGILGAIVFGVTGYAWHKIWVGMGLGMVLAVWAALATLAIYGMGGGSAGGEWVAPAMADGMTTRTWFVEVWNSLAEQTRKILPFACAAALLTGMGASAMWPRFGAVLLYSTLGLSLLVGLGVTAVVATEHKDWLSVVPRQMTSQMIVLASLVAFGAILQWRVVPAKLGDDPRVKRDEKKEKKH